MDPGLSKLVRLPLFAHGLEDVLLSLGFGAAERFLAFGQCSEESFLIKFLNTATVFLPGETDLAPAEIIDLRKETEARSKELCVLWHLIWATLS